VTPLQNGEFEEINEQFNVTPTNGRKNQHSTHQNQSANNSGTTNKIKLKLTVGRNSSPIKVDSNEINNISNISNSNNNSTNNSRNSTPEIQRRNIFITPENQRSTRSNTRNTPEIERNTNNLNRLTNQQHVNPFLSREHERLLSSIDFGQFHNFYLFPNSKGPKTTLSKMKSPKAARLKKTYSPEKKS